MKTCPQCSTGYPDSHTTCPIHGVQLNEIRDLKPGMVIHQSYRIIRKLGQGGMGAVYLAQHTLMNEPQALKFLSSELSQDEAFTARFLREVRTLRQIRHKNVVDAGNLEPSEDGTLFFSMEFVDGPDLRAFLRDARFHSAEYLAALSGHDFSRAVNEPNEAGALAPAGSLPVELALSIARQIAEGLGAAHSKGMVHRDIKPENILMARDAGAWLPKIADFGIVATKESSTAYTRTGGTLLTMAYAAPEQWRGTAAAELDGRTDLYALGGLLYEMLTGQTPFHAENYEGWARQHQTTPPQPPSTLRPDLANWQGLDALVLRLLAKDCEDRPKDVAELVGLIDAVRLVPSRARRETVKENIAKGVSQKSKLNNSEPSSRRSSRFALLVPLLLLATPLALWIFILTTSNQTPQPANSAIQTQPIIQQQPEQTTNMNPSKPMSNKTWTDPDTGLMWTKKDNGSDVNWEQAMDYCRNLQLAGHSDWRLPTIDELQGIYDPNANVGGYHVKGNLQLSTWWNWSSSQGNASGEAWFFTFNRGLRHSYVLAFSGDGRALCVRRSVE